MNKHKTPDIVNNSVSTEMDATQDQQLRSVFQAGDVASEPSAALENRVTEYARRHQQKQVQRQARSRVLRRGFALAGTMAVLVIAAIAWPQLAAAQALRNVEEALARVRSARVVQWMVAPDGSRARFSERWFQDGKMRVEELRPNYQDGQWTELDPEPVKIQFFADGVLRTYEPAKNRVLVQHRKTPFDGSPSLNSQSSSSFSLNTIMQEWSGQGKPRLLDNTMENGRAVRRMLFQPPEDFMRFFLVADAATDLLMRLELQFKKQGQWATVSVTEATFDEALPAELFKPQFPRTAQVIRADNQASGGDTPKRVSLSWTAFSQDGSLLATQGYWSGGGAGYPKREIKLWDVPTGALLRILKLQHPPRHMALSPDGSTLVTESFVAEKNKRLGWAITEFEIWNLETGKSLHKWRPFEGNYDTYMPSIAFSPDSKTLAIPFSERKHDEQNNKTDSTLLLYLLDVQTGRMETASKYPNLHAGSPLYSPDYRWLAFTGFYDVAGRKYQVLLCDGRTGELRKTLATRAEIPSGAKAMAFSTDGNLLATQRTVTTPNPGKDVTTATPRDVEIKLWDTATGELKQTLTRPNCMGGAMALSPNGRLIALSGTQNVFMGGDQIWVWDTRTGELLSKLQIPHGAGSGGPGESLAFTADGSELIYPHHEGEFLRLNVPVG